MNTKNIWGGVAVVLLVVAGYLIFGGETKAPEEGLSGNISEIGTTTSPENKTSAKSPVQTTTVKNPGMTTIAGGVRAYVVNYTNNGFSPSNITIKSGESVRFINLSSHGMWVASDPHPQHNSYGEFDQGKTVGKNAIYDFTFSTKGAWGYHNHMLSSKRGTITIQ